MTGFRLVPSVSYMPRPNGAAIKARRQTQGWKVGKLASAVGISRPHLSNIESRSDRYASVEVLKKLADVLGVPVDAITSDDTGQQQNVCTCGRAA